MTYGGKLTQERLSRDEKRQRHRDMEQCNSLTIGGEDFSTLPETGCLLYFDNTLDQKTRMYNLEKFPDIRTLDDVSDEGQLIMRKSVRSSTRDIYIGKMINIITRCEAFSNQKFPGCIRLCHGYFDAGLCLPMSELIIRILNYLQLAPHQPSYNLLVCLRSPSKLDKQHWRSKICLVHDSNY